MDANNLVLNIDNIIQALTNIKNELTPVAAPIVTHVHDEDLYQRRRAAIAARVSAQKPEDTPQPNLINDGITLDNVLGD